MTPHESELDHLLCLIEERIHLDHCREVDRRYQRALAYEDVDRPPLVVKAAFGGNVALPAPWDGFRRYAYSEGFESPVAMLQNMLLGRVVPGLLLRDDNPLAIRNDHGTVQIASVLGGEWTRRDDDYPWIQHFASRRSLENVANGREVDLATGVLPQSLATLNFYREKLADYPICKEAIQISLPDLQGPLDTAELLWGSDIYYAFHEDRDVLARLLSRIVDTMITVFEHYRRHAVDRLEPSFTTQHGYMSPGRLLIRNDSAIMLSPDTYADTVRPHDARLLHSVGGGAIHFCGDGQHLVGNMLEIPDLLGLDLGQPEMMDIPRICAQCRERKVALTNLQPSREDLISGKARKDFPTGCVMVYQTDNYENASEVARAYCRR